MQQNTSIVMYGVQQIEEMGEQGQDGGIGVQSQAGGNVHAQTSGNGDLG